MSDNKRTFVGGGKKAEKFDIVNFSVCLSDIDKSHIFEYNGKKYVKLSVGAKREVDQYGKTHAVWIDDYKPEPKDDKPLEGQLAGRVDDDFDSLPF